MGVSVVVILSSRRSQLDLLKIQQRSSGICTLRGTNYLDQGGPNRFQECTSQSHLATC